MLEMLLLYGDLIGILATGAFLWAVVWLSYQGTRLD
jgi:hypothetical protein